MVQAATAQRRGFDVSSHWPGRRRIGDFDAQPSLLTRETQLERWFGVIERVGHEFADAQRDGIERICEI